jgi:uncharacterized protein
MFYHLRVKYVGKSALTAYYSIFPLSWFIDFMIRFLILIAIVWLVWFFLRQRIEKRLHKKQNSTKIQTMISCSTCGIHLPKEEALYLKGHYFCSKEHVNDV